MIGADRNGSIWFLRGIALRAADALQKIRHKSTMAACGHSTATRDS